MPEGIPLHRMQSENFFWNSSQKEVSFRRTHILAKVYKCALPLKLQRSVYSNGNSASSGTLINSSFSSFGIRIGCFLTVSKKMFFHNNIAAVSFHSFAVRITSCADSSADDDLGSFFQIDFCELCVLSECHSRNKICFPFPVFSIPPVNR